MPRWLPLILGSPEHPAKLNKFREALSSIAWSETDVIRSLTDVFKAVDDLVEAEVRYYYRRRAISSFASNFLRFLGWLAGTAGILAPLVASAEQKAAGMALWGYPLLATAGALFALNSLFGATTGHVRFVSTQLLLEQIMTHSRLAWTKFISSASGTEPQILKETGFGLTKAYADAVYSATLAETKDWSVSVLSELAKYLQELEAKGGNAAKSPREKGKGSTHKAS